MDNSDWAINKRDEWAHKQHTDIYEDKMGWYARQVDADVYGECLEGESGRVLDIPCGTGRFLGLLEAEHGCFRPVGADYSPTMIAIAQRTTHCPLVRCDGFRLPFRSQCFDILLCSRLVFHYHVPWDLLREFHRVLRVEGVLAFDTLNRYSLRHILARPFNMVRPARGKQLWFASFDQIEVMLAAYEFQVERRISRYILPTRAYRFLTGSVIRLLAAVEPALPESCRVLTYWKARRV